MKNFSHNQSTLICDSPVWDNSLFWWTTTPRLTDCFRQTILVTIAPLVLILLTPFDFRYFINKVSPQSIPWRSRNVSSAVLTLILITISFVHLIRSVARDVLFWSSVFEPLMDFMGLSMAYILQIFYRRNGRRISIALQLFWLMKTIVSIIRLYLEHNFTDNNNSIHNSFHSYYLIIYSLYISLSVVLLFLSNISDEPNDYIRNVWNVSTDTYCPLENESAFSRLTFFWMFGFLRKGFKHKIQFKDLNIICHTIKAKYVSKLFRKIDFQYNRKAINSLSHLYRRPKRLLPVLWSLCYKSILFCHLLLVIYLPALYIQPYILDNILNFLSEGKAYEWHGLTLAVGFSVFGIISTVSYQHMNALMENIALRCKSALIAQVYLKMFRLSPESRRQYTSGEVVNLMAVDCNEVFSFIRSALNISVVPITVCIGFYFLWQYLGIASLGLIVVMVIAIPFNVFFGHKLDKMQKKQMYFKDKRMAKMSEILNCIQIIKLNAWELAFSERVDSLRDAELRSQRKMAIIYAFIVLVWIMAPVLSASACFVAFALIDYTQFNAKTILVSLLILNILRTPMANIPSLFSQLIRAIVSLNRLSKFLSAEELDLQSVIRHKKDKTFSICIENGCFGYSLEDIPVLNDLTINIRRGSLVAIVGEVGAGKSSLLSAIIGDLYKISGNIVVNGSLAFVPQTAWIQNRSLRENVVFMAEEDDDRYEEVLTACALRPDLTTLPAGDRTEIGEKGVNLSGGQKQRVSLARAVFQDSDIYLLDDPLSAVDAHVGQHLFHRVIGPKGLLRNKTRILCSHNLSYLQNCDQIYVLRDGEVVGNGDYSELSALGLIQQIITTEDKPSIDETDNQLVFMESKNLFQSSVNQKPIISQSIDPSIRQHSMDITGDEIIVSSNESTEPTEVENTTEEEVIHLGSVRWKDYGRYISSVGIILFITIPLFRFGSNGSEIALNYWLSLWSNQNESNFDTTQQIINFSIYGSLLASEAVFILLGNIVLFLGTIKASKRVHSRALYGVIQCPLSYFNWTPIGRLLNRFSRDITSVDESIPDLIISLIDVFTFFLVLYALVVYKLLYLSLALLAVIAVFYLIYKFYTKTSRQMRRMESISNSPLQSHVCESIAGALTVRAYDVLPHFITEFNKRLDLSLNSYFHRISLNFWLRIWSQIIGSLITLIISVYIVINRHEMTVPLAGLLLVYSVDTVNNISYTLRLMADLETNMISVERLQELCELSPEKEWKSSVDCMPSHDWPKSGSIEYQNYSTTYRSGLKPVLKDITFTINSGERVGIVGRTGAGKSSLVLSLFRIIEPIGGRILIDGLDVSAIGLHDLRSRLTVIPQESILFNDSLRTNLDPLGDYEDNQLWTALDNCYLTQFVDSLPQKLDFKVSENGDNVSAGQRQLICLARALLRKTKILVLDEAFSSCDLETETMIEKIIREKFNDCTVISIAHRIDGIIHCDRVMVFDFGSLVENDSPKSLLKNKNSFLYSLAKEAKIV